MSVADPIIIRNEERTRCEVWTRVMGYHRPTASFNIGKKGEFRERRCFTEAAAFGHVPAMLKRQAA